MSLAAGRIPNTETITNYGFHFPFNDLAKGGPLLTLLLFLAVGLSFISGSAWLVSFTLTALLINLYPALLVLVAGGCGVFLIIRYLRR